MYFPSRCHSHYSLLLSTLKPDVIAETAKKKGYPAVCLTDFVTISGAIEFHKACKKQEIKPILGCEILVTENHITRPATLTLLCKNKAGWETLLKIVSESNDLGGIPRLTLDQLTKHNLEHFICIDGYEGSLLFYEIFAGHKAAYFIEDYDELAQECLHRDWHDIGTSYISRMRSLFVDYFIESTVDECCSETNPLPVLMSKCAVDLAEASGSDVLIDNPVYYADAVGAIDQRVLLCSHLKCTMSGLNRKIASGDLLDNRLNIFLKSTFFKFHDLPRSSHDKIYELCEDYKITSDPKLPKFQCPDGQSEIEYLKVLCREGWLKKLKASGVINTPDKVEEYKQRVLYELDVVERAGLAGYFLIVQDYVNEFRNRGCLVGPGRGCLYNTNIFLSNGEIKDISEINIGDKIISSDGLSHGVLSVQKYPCEEELLKIFTYYGDDKGISMTKDHKLLAIKRSLNCYGVYEESHNDMRWYKAEDLNIGDCVFQPSIIEDTKNHIFDLAKYCCKKRNGSKIIESGDDYIEVSSTANQFTKRLSRKCNRYVSASHDIAYLLGVFVGDGWLNKHKTCISFCFNSLTNNESQARVISIMTELGCDYTEVKNQNGKNVNQIHFKNYAIYSFFKDIFHEYDFCATSKSIPEFVFNLPTDIKHSFIEGLVASDGHISESRTTITTVSKKLAFQLKYLLLSVGVPSGISSEKRVDSRRDFQDLKRAYYIRFNLNTGVKIYRNNSNGFMVPIRKIETSHTDGYVYDIAVDGDPNYLTTSGIVHNSAAGSLVAYLLGITLVDPIPHGLLFERFFSPGRVVPGKISLPDIDVDFSPEDREAAIQYLRDKFGHDKVGQIATYGRLQGKSALKEVLRVNEYCSFDEMNTITAILPSEGAISDQLEEVEDHSIILWALENESNKLKDYCYVRDGELHGDYSKAFAQAIRLEGTFKSVGKHAAATIVSSDPLETFCPLIKTSRSAEKIIGYDMYSSEDAGAVKMDILGVSALQKIAMTLGE